MRPIRLLAVLLASHVTLLAGASAQVGQRITDVRVEQEGQLVTDPVVLSLVETTLGEPLSMRDVRETTDHLWSLGRFEDVRSLTEPFADGVRLRYVLVPLHPVDRVEFRGALGLSERDLRRMVEDRFGAAPSAGRAGEVAAALRTAYRDRGYPGAQVSARIEETHNPDRASMVLEVQAGRRATIADVRITQIDAREQSTITGAPDIRPGTPYDSAAVERELRRWEETMRASGYYEARASHGPQFDPDGASVFVSVNVRRGPRVVVAFAGDPIPEGERERLVPVREQASADEDLLEDAARAIEEYLFARGYRDADVQYVPEERGDELRITFTVRRGPRHTVDAVRIDGATAIPLSDLRQLLEIRDGVPFVQSMLDAGVAAIVNAYRREGFIGAQITSAVAVLPPDAPASNERRVEVTVKIAEGPRTLVRSLTFTGNAALAEAQLRELTVLAPGRPFSELDALTSRDQIDLEYRNRGYETVVVAPAVQRSPDTTQADVTFAITEGPQTLVDHIIIIGNVRTSTTTIERELVLREGEPLGYSALIDSRARLVGLGLFRRVEIEALQRPGDPRRDVLVRVQELAPTTFGFGGGLEGGHRPRPTGPGGVAEERFEVAPRGFLELGRRNLWGKNRAATLFTRVSLRARDLTEDGRPVPDAEENGYGFNEYRVVGTFREPRVLGTSADMLVTGILDQAIRSSFNFIRREVRGEAGMRLSRAYSVAGRYSFLRIELFDEIFTEEDKPLIDRLFPQVRLSKFAGSLIRDTRDDELDPSRGALLIFDADLAARIIGSEVGFMRTFVQAFAFRRLPAARRIVLAGGVRVGAAHGFPRDVLRVDELGQPLRDENGNQLVDIVEDLPASERFFAGGDTSVRGFSLDRLGNAETISASGFPTGGNGVIVLNGEARVRLFGPIDGVGFVDAGNVFPRASGLDLTDLRPAAGFGVRYRSPIGPVRIDLGFNLDRRELAAGTLERGWVPHISLGHAF